MKAPTVWLGASLLALTLSVIIVAGQEPHSVDIWKAVEISLKQPTMRSDRPGKGFVPDERTAARIGDAVATGRYGEEMISKERPFRAKLYGNTWVVIGTLHPEGALGGTAVVKISKQDGRILFLVHQQ